MRRSLLVLCVFGGMSCASTPPAAVSPWQLVWADEFDVDGAPDAARWGYEAGHVRNHEAQIYTRDPANVRVEGGQLVIEARRDPAVDTGYSSASIKTEGKAAWTYGRIEVRAQLPAGRGVWPAIWTLGTGHPRPRWPQCGEIDIMENVGFEPNLIHTSVHTQAFNHVKGTHKTAAFAVAGATEAFHVYAIEWTRERIDFFVDDQRRFSFANDHSGEAAWPFDRPQFLLLSLAVGGDWGGQRGIDESAFPARLRIDYVRVYERATGRPRN